MRTLIFRFFLVFMLNPVVPLLAQGPSCPRPDSLSGLGAIVGRVVDGQNRVPLGFAQIRLMIHGVQDPIEARSNTSGQFQFCSVPSGVFTLAGQLGQLGNLLGPLRLDPGVTLSLSLELGAVPTSRETGTLAGLVIDAQSEEPVEGATIIILNLGQTGISNSFGRFNFSSLPPGNVDLQVNRLGFAEARGRVEVQAGNTVHTRVTLSTEPIALDPIAVTAVRRRIELPGLEEFERRFNSGWGQFILEDEIQRRAPIKLTQMLHETGVNVMGDGKAIYMRRTRCAPLVYLDGVKLTHIPRGGGSSRPGTATMGRQYLWPDPEANAEQEAADAVNLVHPSEIRAVEIYRGPAETPGQYLDSNSMCGVILIWTRRGNISGG